MHIGVGVSPSAEVWEARRQVLDQEPQGLGVVREAGLLCGQEFGIQVQAGVVLMAAEQVGLDVLSPVTQARAPGNGSQGISHPCSGREMSMCS